MAGAEWVGDTGLGAQKGFGGSRVFSGFLWSLVPRRLGSEWGAGRETRVEAFAMKPALDGVGRGSRAAHVRRDCCGPSGRVCCWLDGASEGGVRAAGFDSMAERWGAEERQGRPRGQKLPVGWAV